jgi:hypothetical protein
MVYISWRRSTGFTNWFANTKSVVVCSSVCDHDATVLRNRTKSKKVITHTVQTTIYNSCSCVQKCETVRRCVQQ